VTALRTVRDFLSRPRTLLAVYLLAAVGASLHAYVLSARTLVPGGENYTRYDVFLIQRQSFHHLVHGQDLYLRYPTEHQDLFKYSPTFAVLFAPIALLPVLPGLVLWNALNAFVFWLGLSRFPHWKGGGAALAMWFCLVEAFGSIQYGQVNPLLAGLLLLAFTALEERRDARGVLLVLLTAFTKLFGLAVLALGIFHPRKLRLAALAASGTAALAALPLLFVPPGQLAFLYRRWLYQLSGDRSELSFSVMGWLKTWFGLEPGGLAVVAVGAVLMGLPLLRRRSHGDPVFRSLAMAGLLTWVVIFNHRAESPTYVIAVAGVALWYGVEERPWWDKALLALAFVFTILPASDVFPRPARAFFRAHVVKTVPVLIVWAKIVAEMMLRKPPARAAGAAE
jgi:hypothetical protein